MTERDFLDLIKSIKGYRRIASDLIGKTPKYDVEREFKAGKVERWKR